MAPIKKASRVLGIGVIRDWDDNFTTTLFEITEKVTQCNKLTEQSNTCILAKRSAEESKSNCTSVSCGSLTNQSTANCALWYRNQRVRADRVFPAHTTSRVVPPLRSCGAGEGDGVGPWGRRRRRRRGVPPLWGHPRPQHRHLPLRFAWLPLRGRTAEAVGRNQNNAITSKPIQLIRLCIIKKAQGKYNC